MHLARSLAGLVLGGILFAACSSEDDGAAGPGTDPDASVGAPGASSGAPNPGDGSSPQPDGSSTPDGGPPSPVCEPPVTLVDTRSPTTVVGDGSPASCTELAFTAAVAAGGIVTFACGSAPFTLAISSEKNPPLDRDTVIDGGGLITLDAGNVSRHFGFVRDNYRTSETSLTLQRLRMINGKAPGSGYVAPSDANPACAYGFAEGGGGAVIVRDNLLTVIDCIFEDNQAASPGPDVGGGAIYALGSLGVTVVGSRFERNHGSNAGAIGLLQTEGRIVNSSFVGNRATGTGMNYAGGAAAGCPGVGHENQGGAGGNGGALAIDGSSDTDQVFCGCRFEANQANELAGALFRTANVDPRRTAIDRTLFRGNTARQAGALYLNNSQPLEIHASSFVANRADGAGMAQFDRCQLDLENTTIFGNVAATSLGGAIANGSTTGRIRNVTFANNEAKAGPGIFSAAIAGGMDFEIVNSVFANNLTADAGSPMTCAFATAHGSNNLQWPQQRPVGGADDVACVDDVVFADAQVQALEDIGPTPSAAVSAASPARGQGRGCPATDQRGRPRSVEACTLGAVE